MTVVIPKIVTLKTSIKGHAGAVRLHGLVRPKVTAPRFVIEVDATGVRVMMLQISA